MTVHEYQSNVANSLGRKLGVQVTAEWAAMSGQRGVYSPKLDIAVGPFATGNLQQHARYDELQHQHRPFLEVLHRHHIGNIRRICDADPCTLDHALELNFNARCFLGIEIENRVSRKHLMGGAINASALGRLGVAIAWTETNLRAFGRLWMYLRFLSNVGKNSFDTSNLLIVSADQFQLACDQDHFDAA